MAVDLLDRPADEAAPAAPRPDPAPAKASPAPASVAAPRRFAGFTFPQLIIGALMIAFAVWAMWATRELQALQTREKIVTVRLSGLISDFVGAAARSGEPEEVLAKRTQAYMAELQKALKARSDAGQIVLVGEAVVSSSVEDITPAIAAQVAKVVPYPAPRAASAAAPATQVPMAMPAAAAQAPMVAPVQSMAAAPPAAMAPVAPQPAPVTDPTAGMTYPFGSGQ